MYNKNEVSRLVQATLDTTGYVFRGGEFQHESFEELLGFLEELVDETHVDLTHVSGNDFTYFSEYARTQAEHDGHAMPPTYFAETLVTRLTAMEELVKRDAVSDEFLVPIAEAIVAAASWVVVHFDEPDDLQCELSIFDDEDGIDEVDEDAGFDEHTDF